jgi:hypothetical protein
VTAGTMRVGVAPGRHALHVGERVWPESNCYIDLWIELLHARGLDPVAALPFTLTTDFEGDQWTFGKFPHADLRALYSIEIIELNVWRPLLWHLEEQLAMARTPIVEVDGFYLADTAGTSYRAEHVKTTIAIRQLDSDARRLDYWHNAGAYEISGEDFSGLFNLEHSHQTRLAPYVEVVKRRTRPPCRGRTLVDESIRLLCHHVAHRPATNPFHRYADRLTTDLDWLAAGTLDDFHGYAFATFRQYGAAFELAAAYLRWLERHGELELDAVAVDCDAIASAAKALQFKVARLAQTRRRFEFEPIVETMATAWDNAMNALELRYGALPLHD